MTALVERYTADAADYAHYWAPVLQQTAHRLLEILDPVVASYPSNAPRVLDVGAGTGSLVLAALERWPRAEIIASDAAAGMLALAGRHGEEAGFGDDRRLQFVLGPADSLPMPDASVDIVMSSFVLQLVPDRLAALRELHRLLRPGGTLAYVTWLDREERPEFRPGAEFDEAVYDLNVEEPGESDEPIAGDLRSGRAAADELRRADFVKASGREETLIYDWTMESYVDYKLAYDERALLSMLTAAQRRELERNARDRLSRLAPSEFRWHAPVVFARATRP